MPDMRLTPLLVLPALLLTGCAAEDRVAAPAAAAQEVAAVSGLAADLQPLQAEALALAGLVLAAAPSPEVAAVVERVAAGTRDLADEAGTTPGLALEAAQIADGELRAVREAAGDEAVRLGLDGLLRNALETVQAAKAVLNDSTDAADRALAEKVLLHTDAVVQDLAALS
jgi:hypothetical protein